MTRPDTGRGPEVCEKYAIRRATLTELGGTRLADLSLECTKGGLDD
jgi:hypothetical protein